MRLSSLALVLALTCIQVQSQDVEKQLRGAKKPESNASTADLPADSRERDTAAGSRANDPTKDTEYGVQTPSMVQTMDPPKDPDVPNDIGVPEKEVPADGTREKDADGTRLPVEPLDEWEDDAVGEGPEPMEWVWVPYRYVTEGPEEFEGRDDEIQQEILPRDVRSFVAWHGGRGGGRAGPRHFGPRGWRRRWVRRWGRRWARRHGWR